MARDGVQPVVSYRGKPDVERPALSATRNATTVRPINEAIEEGRVTAGGPIAFLCECSRLGCDAVIELSLEDYEAVRSDGRCFVVAPGHEAAGDAIVRRSAHHVVASRCGPAGDEALRTDPRAEGPVVQLLWSHSSAVPALQMALEATRENVRRARRFVTAFAAGAGADRDQLSRIELAVTEATINAVLHAYPPETPGLVHLAADLGDGDLEVVVADDGTGLRPSPNGGGLGLGLAIVARCSDRFAVRERVPQGTEIWMLFTLRPR